MKRIKLTKGKYAIVDDEDFDSMNQKSWHFSTKGYACAGTHTGSAVNGTRRTVRFFMHRLINKTPDGLQTDHINRNKLDNRRSNLRTVTNQQNHFNMPLSRNNATGCKGVYWFKRDKNWQSQITVGAKRIHLGYFINFKDAVSARKRAELKYYEQIFA